MKKIYNIILTILTIAILVLVTFNKLNQIANWVDMSAYQDIINTIWSYGPVVLMCLFAFGGMLGKMLLSKILFVVVIIILVIFSITMFAPQLIANIFG